MKILILILLTAASLNVSQAQIKMMYDTEKSEKEKIEGFVSTGYSKITITRVDTDEIDWQTDSTKIINIEIDKGKNIYTEINYTPQYSKTIIKFDKNIISREIFNEKNELQGKTLYYYDEQGKLKKRELYFGDMKAFDEIYEYESGKLSKMKYLMSDGTLVSYSTFTFDDDNNLLEELKYSSSGEQEYKYEYTYDKKSKLTEERIILGKDNITNINYSYNSDGRLTEKATTSKGKQTSNVKYTFQGSLLSEEIYDTPELKIKKTYTYNNGLLKQIKYFEIIDVNSYVWVYNYE